MKYLSLDLETTGLDPDQHDIIEFGAVLDDLSVQAPLDELPHFHAYILPPFGGDTYSGQPYALSMHADIFRRIAKRENDEHQVGRGGVLYLRPDELAHRFAHWCRKLNLLVKPRTEPAPEPHPDAKESVRAAAGPQLSDIKFVPAGKNVSGFDVPFLKANIDGWDQLKVSHRALDPGMLFFNPVTDKVPPNLSECLKRAGLPSVVAHTAVDDALQVIELLRSRYPLELFNAAS